MNNPFEGAVTAQPLAASLGPSSAPHAEALVFSGRGAEYFGIWIVNLLLSIVTLGIYSAWAKVRRLQYFHRHTTLGGAAFDYHGDPRAILKGRVIGVILLAAYHLSFEFSVALGIAVAVVLAAVLPLLLMRSLKFRARNTSWRGLRFAFDGDERGAYAVFLMWPLLSVVTLYLLAPMWHQRVKRYQLDNVRFGTTRFRLDVPVSAFYRMYGVLFLLVLAGLLAMGATMVGLIALSGGGPGSLSMLPILLMLGWLAVLMLVQPYLLARLQNVVWNNTHLGPHRFESRARARTLYAITLTNLIAIMCTFGLFMPFAAIRLARYRIESVTMICAGSLDDFVAGQSQDVAAIGEEAADLFDVDIAL